MASDHKEKELEVKITNTEQINQDLDARLNKVQTELRQLKQSHDAQLLSCQNEMDEKTRSLNDQVFALQTQVNALNVDNGGLKDDIKQRQSELEMLTDKLKQTEQAR